MNDRSSDHSIEPTHQPMHATEVFQQSNPSWETEDPSEPISLTNADTVPLNVTRQVRRRGLIAEVIEGLADEFFIDIEYGDGESLLQQGEPASGLILIREGSVEIVDRASGHVIDVDGTGSLLGEMSLLTGRACSADVIATTPIKAQLLPRDRYQEACKRFPRLELALGQIVSCRLGTHDHDALCGKTLGGYRIEECVNRGGMGVIYRATGDGDQTVALKMLMHKFIDDPIMHQRFNQEAELLGSLNHPNIVSLIGHFLEFRTRFLVLEFCDGSDLLRLLQQQERLGEDDARAIAGQIAAGLFEAHSHGIWHRDLKPANVLVDRSGQIRVTDFGLSRLREIDVPDDRVVGTPSFMAPEQFIAAESGAAADWYGLACLIAQLMAGEVLFKAPDVCEMFRIKSLARPAELLRERLPASTSQELLDVLGLALEPQIERREMDLARIAQWARPVPHLMR